MLAALLTMTLLVGPTSVGPTPRCAYLVRHAEAVRDRPARSAKIVDHLGKGDRALGACRAHRRWLTVVGTRRAKQGYAPSRSLDSLGTLRSVIH